MVKIAQKRQRQQLGKADGSGSSSESVAASTMTWKGQRWPRKGNDIDKKKEKVRGGYLWPSRVIGDMKTIE